MFRNLLRLLSSGARNKPVRSDQQLVLYAHVDREPCQPTTPVQSLKTCVKTPGTKTQATRTVQTGTEIQAELKTQAGPRIQTLSSKANLAHLRPSCNHRARLLSMRLEHTQLCSRHRCDRLGQLGIVTAGDLASATPERLANQFRASRRALRVLKEYRRAIRFAASVPGMMPRDAMLLISIHRRSARALSMESAARLQRDLERFAQSSHGQIQLRGRRLPSTRRLKQWINQCKESIAQSPAHARAA